MRTYNEIKNDRIYTRVCERCLNTFKTRGKMARVCFKCCKGNGTSSEILDCRGKKW